MHGYATWVDRVSIDVVATSVGLDLGSVHSRVVWYGDDGDPVVGTSPSAVYIDEDGNAVTGTPAEARGREHPAAFVRHPMRHLARIEPLLVRGAPWPVEPIVGALARQVLDPAGWDSGAVAVVHPVTWGPSPFDALSRALRAAGIRVGQYVTSTAATAACAVRNGCLEPGQVALHYALGGGRFETAALRIHPWGGEVLGQAMAIEGFGGSDLDQALASAACERSGTSFAALTQQHPAEAMALLEQCRQAREQLSDTPQTTIGTPSGRQALARADLDTLFRGPLQGTLAAARAALQSAGMTSADVVLLSGGVSAMPLVHALVAPLGSSVVRLSHPAVLGAVEAGRPASRVQSPTWPEARAATSGRSSAGPAS